MKFIPISYCTHWSYGCDGRNRSHGCNGSDWPYGCDGRYGRYGRG